MPSFEPGSGRRSGDRGSEQVLGDAALDRDDRHEAPPRVFLVRMSVKGVEQSVMSWRVPVEGCQQDIAFLDDARRVGPASVVLTNRLIAGRPSRVLEGRDLGGRLRSYIMADCASLTLAPGWFQRDEPTRSR